jgi:hypothetical protein
MGGGAVLCSRVSTWVQSSAARLLLRSTSCIHKYVDERIVYSPVRYRQKSLLGQDVLHSALTYLPRKLNLWLLQPFSISYSSTSPLLSQLLWLITTFTLFSSYVSCSMEYRMGLSLASSPFLMEQELRKIRIQHLQSYDLASPPPPIRWILTGKP